MYGQASWYELVWLLCQPVQGKPAGLGMSFHDAIRLTPRQANFLLMDRKQVRAMAARQRARQAKASGVVNIREDIQRYQDDQREAFTGSRERPITLTHRDEREAIKAEMRRRRQRREAKQDGQG